MKTLWRLTHLLLISSIIVLTLLLIAISSVSFTPAIGYLSDQCNQLRMVWTIGLGLCFSALFLLKNRKGSFLACLGLIMNLWHIVPFYLPVDAKQSCENPRSELTMVALNLYGNRNRSYTKTIAYLQQSNADIICLSEVNKTWMKRISNELPEYKFHFDEGIAGGAAIFSKVPIERVQPTRTNSERRYGVRGICKLAGESVLIISEHPPSPSGRKRWQNRNKEFSRLASELADTKLATILIGDLNSTPWSTYYKRLLASSNLKDSEQGMGIQPSWNALLVVPPLIPIDHCLVSKDFAVIDRHLGPNVGSDHLPVYVKLQLQSHALPSQS